MKMKLTAEAEADRAEFDAIYGLDGCRCFQHPPCGCCIHPGNPVNQAEDERCWEEEDVSLSDQEFCNCARIREAVDSIGAKKLMKRAQQATSIARPMVTDFPVGAAARLKNGSVVVAANVENVTLNLTQCAERNLVMQLVLLGRESETEVVAVYGPKAEYLSPCGSCRQLMREYLSPQTVVLFRWGADFVAEATVAELLPWTPEVTL